MHTEILGNLVWLVGVSDFNQDDCPTSDLINCPFLSPPQDQFDNLEKHTQWGIEYLEKYTKFVKERSEIEVNYAKQIR